MDNEPHHRSFHSIKLPFSLKKKRKKKVMASYDDIVKDVPEPKKVEFFACMEAKTDDGWDPGKKKKYSSKFDVTSGSLCSLCFSPSSLSYPYIYIYILVYFHHNHRLCCLAMRKHGVRRCGDGRPPIFPHNHLDTRDHQKKTHPDIISSPSSYSTDGFAAKLDNGVTWRGT